MTRWARSRDAKTQTYLPVGKALQQRMRAHIVTPKRRLPKLREANESVTQTNHPRYFVDKKVISAGAWQVGEGERA